MENVIPKVVALVIEQLRNTTPIYGIDCARQVSNKAGANWIAARDMVATLSIWDIVPQDLMEKYLEIDFDVADVSKDPVKVDGLFSFKTILA